jgi:hypothetical protein
MIETLPLGGPDLVAVRVSGTLSADDVDRYRRLLEPVMRKHGTARLYFEMVDFHGWTPGGFAGNAVFDLTHGASFGNVAMVGEKKWQDWIATLVDPVKKGEVRYFDLADRDAALQWLGYAPKGV